ncbi:hypothetical protein OFB58_25695, partial [Escherichia coli]|nr:hypothetical protein [Escherichia coli]
MEISQVTDFQNSWNAGAIFCRRTIVVEISWIFSILSGNFTLTEGALDGQHTGRQTEANTLEFRG